MCRTDGCGVRGRAYIADKPLFDGVRWFSIELSLSVAIFADRMYENVTIK